jgi:proteasome lid subunit RPN8/RPN11
MTIAQHIITAVQQHARADMPRECCGLVTADAAGDQTYWPCRNIAEDERDFVLCPDDLARIEDQCHANGTAIVAVAHSHVTTGARASMADLCGCEDSGLPWMIVQAITGAHIIIQPNGFSAPLVGRPYAYGVHDCWTLVRDYFARTHGATLPAIAAPHGWWDRGEDLFRQHLGACGFVELPADAAQVGDVLMMQFRASVPQHLGVLLPDGNLLHHLLDRNSRVDVWGSYWRERVVGVARWQGAAS